MGELSKIIGEKWKGLTDEEKAPFQKKAEADKVRLTAVAGYSSGTKVLARIQGGGFSSQNKPLFGGLAPRESRHSFGVYHVSIQDPKVSWSLRTQA